MCEVVHAVIRPEATIVEAQDVVDPVRGSRDLGGPLVGRRAPVVASVRGAPSYGVCCQDLGTCAVVATLLPRCILRAVGTTQRSVCDVTLMSQ